jgi:hypothetical protein
MKQRGRKGVDALLTTVTGIPNRPEPPDTLPERQKSIWRQTVSSKAAGWWDTGSLPLLSAFVASVHELEILNEQLGLLKVTDRSDPNECKRYTALVTSTERVGKLMMALARAQRLNQSAQYHPRTAATRTIKTERPKPWEF